MQSMTGYGSASVNYTTQANKRITFMISIRTVNARFFEYSVKTPPQLATIELAVAKQLRQELLRGSAQCTITSNDTMALKGSVTISATLVEQYLAALQQVQQETNLPGTITINDLMRIPTIYAVQDLEADEALATALLQGVHQALQAVIAMRTIEGTALQADMSRRLTIIRDNLHTIEQQFATLFATRKAQTEATLQQLQNLAPEALENHRVQLMNTLERMDIAEEITRLHTHLQAMQELVGNKQQEKGKKLEFLLQEAGREINTLMAKSADAALAQHAITIKVELEKIREQVQNIV